MSSKEILVRTCDVYNTDMCFFFSFAFCAADEMFGAALAVERRLVLDVSEVIQRRL